MKLTRKLTLALALSVLLVLALGGYLQTRREVALFNRDSSRDHQLLATKLAAAVGEVRKLEGDRVAEQVLTRASPPGAPVQIRWVRLENGETGEPPLALDAARRALASHREVQVVDERGAGMLLTYHPIPGESPALLELSESLAEQRAYTRVTVLNVCAATLIVGVVCGLVAYGLGASIVGAPVRQLVDKARRVGRGDLKSPLVLRANDELGLLAREMNARSENLANARARADAEAAARIGALEQLRHADRLATVGKLAAGIAHELGTPLNVVAGRAQMIESGKVEAAEARSSARIIARQAERMSAIIRQLLDFARQGNVQTSQVELLQLLQEAVDLLAPLGQKRRVRVQVSAASRTASATVSRGHMLQAVMNLIVNAVQASRENAVVDVEVGQSHNVVTPNGKRGSFATITVKDSGQGMTREVKDHAFEPFFTTKGVGEGTGLGLSVAYGIVSDHGGFITVRSEPGLGSDFRIHLPLTRSDSEPLLESPRVDTGASPRASEPGPAPSR
jgi:signal transduction histidine kinase